MKLSDTVVIALITATPPTILSAASLVTSWRGADKVAEVAVKVDETAAKVEVVHKATNSMKDALVKVTRSDALQEGYADGVKDEKERKK